MDFGSREWMLGGGTGQPPAMPMFSQGVKAGPLIFTAGHAAIDEKGQLVGANDIRVQTEQTLKNIGSVLENFGASFKDVVKVTIWITDYDNYAGMNEVYAKFFPEPRPPRACVNSKLVPLLGDEFLVEIEAMAVVAE
ncbi:MAG: RidA family protein [Rhodospirillaceae bacterium]|jgi:2-iminobutanoate/2-iminopropanoate deaminase|nr:RidA family protein [Rhodospirillaceae bacterium]MBT5564806.1 RidA family protein [Rhodospirillaceae bacterium]MBT6088013.1 RidA family protein [Rhodospirillaceae bacterium]MBT6960315.1 RidA family protein [Rhodospirillaceae bacterium]MBT7449608.1 RidA family protein [Rhodospirillaceae bacterium]